jgi:putative drug exporter of the RND superfamily
MFQRLGNVVVRHPWRVIAAWIVGALLLTTVAPGLKTTSDQSSFLPGSYESVKAQHLADQAFPESAGLSAVTVLKRSDNQPLSSADRTAVKQLAAALSRADVAGVSAVSTSSKAVSKDGRVALVAIEFSNGASGSEITDAVNNLRDRTASNLAGTGLDGQMAGAPAQFADLSKAGSNAESTVATATIALILILLLVIFRSPIAALVPILTVAVVSVSAMALIGLAADAFGLQADPSIGSLLVIVLFGIGTDYTLFLLFRIRERLRAGDGRREAVAFAVGRVGVTVAYSATVVIAAILALSLSQLESNRVLAPSLAIAVLVMLMAALTLVPAVLSLLGPRIFWPSRRWRKEPSGGPSARIAGFISRRPMTTVALSVAVLLGLAAAALGLKSDYNTTGDLSSSAESVKAQATLTAAFPQLTANPTSVLISAGSSGEVKRVAARLADAPGVAGVSEPEQGKVGIQRLSVYLAGDSAFSDAALSTVADHVRPIAHSVGGGATALVGGPTSTVVDVRTAMNRDYRVIFPVAALIILIVLALVLRSLVAPWVLLGAVVLGFAATLGATVMVFQGLAGHSGISFALPLTMYVFVVAVGTDYNILIATRLREEQQRSGYTRAGVERGTRASLPTIASAAVILAATFASLLLTSLNSDRELGFGVSAGILLTALVMASILVPSAVALLGRRFWWPGSRCLVTTWPSSKPEDRAKGSSNGKPAPPIPAPSSAGAATGRTSTEGGVASAR